MSDKLSASPAQISDEPKEKYILIGTGEGAYSAVVDDLCDGLHGFMCFCGQSLVACKHEDTLEMLKEMEDDDNWSVDEFGRRHQYSFEGYCYGISVTILRSRLEPVEAPKERLDCYCDQITCPICYPPVEAVSTTPTRGDELGRGATYCPGTLDCLGCDICEPKVSTPLPQHALEYKEERNGWHYRMCICGVEIGPFFVADYADDAFDAHCGPALTQQEEPAKIAGEEKWRRLHRIYCDKFPTGKLVSFERFLLGSLNAAHDSLEHGDNLPWSEVVHRAAEHVKAQPDVSIPEGAPVGSEAIHGVVGATNPPVHTTERPLNGESAAYAGKRSDQEPIAPLLGQDEPKLDGEEVEVWVDPRTKEPCRRCDGTGKMPPWPGSKGLVVCGICRAEMRPTSTELPPHLEHLKEVCLHAVTKFELTQALTSLAAAQKQLDHRFDQVAGLAPRAQMAEHRLELAEASLAEARAEIERLKR